jgi:hypothetical protein
VKADDGVVRAKSGEGNDSSDQRRAWMSSTGSRVAVAHTEWRRDATGTKSEEEVCSMASHV